MSDIFPFNVIVSPFVLLVPIFIGLYLCRPKGEEERIFDGHESIVNVGCLCEWECLAISFAVTWSQWKALWMSWRGLYYHVDVIRAPQTTRTQSECRAKDNVHQEKGGIKHCVRVVKQWSFRQTGLPLALPSLDHSFLLSQRRRASCGTLKVSFERLFTMFYSRTYMFHVFLKCKELQARASTLAYN